MDIPNVSERETSIGDGRLLLLDRREAMLREGGRVGGRLDEA